MRTPSFVEVFPDEKRAIAVLHNKAFFKFPINPYITFILRKSELRIAVDPYGLPLDCGLYAQTMCHKASELNNLDIVSRC